TGTVDVEGPSGATLDGVAVTTHSKADAIEVGQTSTATLTLDGGTTMTGGTPAIGAVGGTGTVEVEGSLATTLDGVPVAPFATADTIEVDKITDALLVLDDG